MSIKNISTRGKILKSSLQLLEASKGHGVRMSDADAETAKAWAKRMQDMRQGCQAAIDMLASDNMLVAEYSTEQATDILWTMLSVKNWEQLTQDCGWKQQKYIETLKLMARQLLVTS